MTIRIIADTHVAAVWDTLDDLFDQNDYRNPNSMLRKVINKTDSATSLVFNGDIVDYYFQDYIPERGSNKSNWDLFYTIMADSASEYLCNRGNHDYRTHAYNFSITGLDSVNIGDDAWPADRNIPHTAFRGLYELYSLIPSGIDTFADFPNKANYYRQMEDHELVFLDTGPDAFIKPEFYFNPSLVPDLTYASAPVQGVVDRLVTSPAEGLNQRQLMFLRKRLATSSKENVVIFLHHPPFFSSGGAEQLRLTEPRYHAIARANGPDFGYEHVGFVKNNWAFIKILLESEKNIMVVTSDTHIPGQHIIDKQGRMLRDSTMNEVNAKRWDNRYITFLSTLPLGKTNETNSDVGVLDITNSDVSYTVLDAG